MKELLLVFIGGGSGSMLRYLLGRYIGSSAFPLGTFAVNVVGCFLIGLLGAWIVRHSLSPDLRLLLVVGLCGGFTTFSTFSNEALGLMRSGQPLLCFAYIVASVALTHRCLCGHETIIKDERKKGLRDDHRPLE